MRRGAIFLTMVSLLIGLLSAARPATSQEPMPTPRGRLGGREPLSLTPALPSPTATSPATPTPTPTAVATETPATVGGTPPSIPISAVSGDDASWEAAAARVLPAVVAVVASGSATGIGTPTTVPPTVGSGFFVDAAGHVVTAEDVVSGAGAVAVVLGSGERRPAAVVGVDAVSGLAVLRVNGAVPASVTLGSAAALRPGQPVLAAGVAAGELPASVTAGIVGAGRRAAPSGLAATSVVEHDAPVPSGAEGGPLTTRSGEVVGVNLAPVSERSGVGRQRSEAEARFMPSLSYAVPGDTVRQVLDALIAEGRVRHPYLGAIVRPVTPTVAVEVGLPVAAGAEVVEVVADGPAARDGLQVGDIIVSLNDQHIDAAVPFGAALLARRPDERVAIVVRRGDAEVVLTVVLADRPTDGEEPERP